FRPAPFRAFGVNLFRPVNKSMRASSRVASVEEVFSAVTLGDDPIQLFTFGLLRAALRARHIAVNDRVVAKPLHCHQTRWREDFHFPLALAQLVCQFGFGHFVRAPFFFAASLGFVGFLGRHFSFLFDSIESSLIFPCLNIVSSMTSIIERNSGKSAYLLRHALNSSNACCSSSAFSDSVMISSPPIVIALLIFPTLLLQLVFQSRLLFGANFLAGLLRPAFTRKSRQRYF